MYVTDTVYTSFFSLFLITATLSVATAGVLTLIGWRNCKARRGARYVSGEQRKRANFPALGSSG